MPAARWRLKIAAGVLGVLLVSLAVVNYCRVYCCAPIHLTLSGGNVCPLRSQMAHSICGEIHDAGISLECVAGTHSESICASVDKGELDLGLVLGGFPPDTYKNVRQVASFGVDPLHLLVRRELVTLGPPTLEVLRGKRVSLGETGTNGALLAESLARFAGLRPSTDNRTGDFLAEHLRDRDLHTALQAIRKASPENRAAFAAILPDAVFIVDSLPSPAVDELVTIGGYQLLPLPFATALQLDSRRDHGRSHSQLENSRLENVTIPAYTYGISPPTPATNCETFGLRLLLVTNKKTPATAVLRVLRALDSGVADRYQIKLDVADQDSEFPIHLGAEAFAKGRKPMILSDLVEPVGNFMSVAGAAAAGAFGVWGFLRGLRAVHPDVYLRKIARIERLARGDEQDIQAPALPRDFLEYLEAQLAVVKQSAIDDYAHRRLVGDEALVGILTLVADTRHLLVQRRKQVEYQERCLPERPTRLADAA
jgi:TRAP-type uncharacterized transport system substrate-binding protein